MNRIVLIVVALALILGVVVFVGKKKSETPPGAPSETPGAVTSPGVGESHPAEEPGNENGTGAPGVNGTITPNGPPSGKPGQSTTPVTNGAKVAPVQNGTAAGGNSTSGANGTPDGTKPSTPGETVISGGKMTTPNQPAKNVHDGVDGNIGKNYQPGVGDDGEGAPAPKPTTVPSLAGVKSPKVWLVAEDLKKTPGAKPGAFEVGYAGGSKTTSWKNRSGLKYGDGVRAKGGTTATYARSVQTTHGSYDAVAFCPPATAPCVNSEASQIKVGLDINHPDSWVNGPDNTGKSAKGGSSFTALFVAARGSKAANPLLENQGGEAGAKQGPFMGWIGADFVGSIHGLQGIVGLTSVSVPAPWHEGMGIVPSIYTLRFDRKKADLRLFQLNDQSGSTANQAIEKGDGPDNNQYAAIAMGSKNPDKGVVTYVFEAATFSRALSDSEICSIHKEWNKKYSLGIAVSQMKPCR
jgi:hypothetical protein